MHFAMQAAKESEVGIQRRNICIERIVHFYSDDIVGANRQVRSHIKSEGGKTALVLANKAAVDINIGN